MQTEKHKYPDSNFNNHSEINWSPRGDFYLEPRRFLRVRTFLVYDGKEGRQSRCPEVLPEKQAVSGSLACSMALLSLAACHGMAKEGLLFFIFSKNY